MKVLIVEDDVVLSKMYQKKFELEGFQVAAVYSGGEGIVAAQREKPDVILLDIMMPAMDGFSVTKALNEDEVTRKIPVIILTNLGTSQIFIDEAKRLGVKEYLIKYKTSTSQVIETIKKVLEKKE